MKKRMQLIKWEPLNEIERFFDERALSPMLSKVGWDMAVDVYEEKDTVIAKMNLPGVQADELDISIDEDALTVSGMRQEEKETKEKDYYSKEIRRGSFSRAIELPKSVDAAKASAAYKDGVLQVTMPIVKGAQRNPVQVKIAKK